nr:esterase [uncultured bacterium]
MGARKSMIQDKTIQLGDVQLHYVEAAGTGPNLILVHGITSALTSYLPLIPALTQDAHVYALDLRGHDQSSHVPGAYHISDYGRDLDSFISTVVGEPVIVAGHSLGALVATWAGANAGTNIRGILLEDPPMYSAQMPRIKAGGAYRYFVHLRQMLDAHAAAGASVDDLAEQLGQSPAGEGQTLLDVMGSEWMRDFTERVHRLDPRVLDAPIEGWLFDGFDPDTDLPRVECPVHLLAGEVSRGGELTTADVQRIATSIPHCTYTVVEAGHGIHDEQPEVYLHALRQMLKAVG